MNKSYVKLHIKYKPFLVKLYNSFSLLSFIPELLNRFSQFWYEMKRSLVVYLMPTGQTEAHSAAESTYNHYYVCFEV